MGKLPTSLVRFLLARGAPAVGFPLGRRLQGLCRQMGLRPGKSGPRLRFWGMELGEGLGELLLLNPRGKSELPKAGTRLPGEVGAQVVSRPQSRVSTPCPAPVQGHLGSKRPPEKRGVNWARL